MAAATVAMTVVISSPGTHLRAATVVVILIAEIIRATNTATVATSTAALTC